MACANIAGLLLAGGDSYRFGGQKLAVPFCGKPLAQWAADALSRTRLNSYHAVVNSKITSIEHIFSSDIYQINLNNSQQNSLSASLRIGLEAISATPADAALVLLADMPLVQTAHLNQLVNAYQENPGLYASTDLDQRSPPAVLPREIWPSIMQQSGDKGARQWLKDAMLISAAPGTLSDIDTPDDLDRLNRVC